MKLSGVEILDLAVREDTRGWVVEILRAEQIERPAFGQIYVTTAHPNHAKGNHYHQRKTEWFCVIKGRGLLALEDLHTHKRQEIPMGEGHMVTVKIPPNLAHGIRNVGDDLMFLLAYIDEPFSASDPDTIRYEVI